MNALAEFKDYYKRLDKLIAESTKENLAALNCVLNIRYVFGQTEWSGVNSPLRRPQTPSDALRGAVARVRPKYTQWYTQDEKPTQVHSITA